MSHSRPPVSNTLSEGAGVFVSLVWVAALVIACVFVLNYGSRHIPAGDDWDGIVPYLTGRLPITPAWFWSQHNEHRLLLPRVLLLGILKFAGGDFCSVMLLDVFALGCVSLVLLLVVRRIRDRFRMADAFIPFV